MPTTKWSTILLVASGCAMGGDTESTTQDVPPWDEFRANVYVEDFPGGHFIVNGDIAIKDEKQLYEFWASLQPGGLIVNTQGGSDDRWNDTAKRALTYCVSDAFGANKAKIVAALTAATAKWAALGDVRFQHVTAEDARCTASNTTVVFDVRPVSGQQYLARAFFPSSARASRNVLVDSSAFGDVGWPLENIIGHELGHALGFRHEHTRPEAGACFEDTNWRDLTAYDGASIMHYPHCNGASQDLGWSAKDAEGVVALYGLPGSSPPPPTGGTPSVATASGAVAHGQLRQVGSVAVKPGTTLTATMIGTGDPDLYVRWNHAPTTRAFHCRPYLDGADETCALTAPAGATRAYVAVRGYRAGTFELTVEYTRP